MAKRTSDNLRIKRKYFVWLAEAKGLSQASVDKAAAAIASYDQCLSGKDYKAFHPERARAFKRHLARLQNQRTGAPLSPNTIGSILREIMSFFHWLADQPGYKSRIARDDIAYLTPDRKSEQSRRASLWKPHPSLEQAHHVISTMPTDTVLERRNQALVAFLFLTGSRVGAAISVRLGHVDLPNKCVQFDARSVNTKFGKSFTTNYFPVGDDLEQVLTDWIIELRRDHLFAEADPVFPQTRVEVGANKLLQAVGIDREPWACTSAAAMIFKQSFTQAGLPPFSPHRARDMVAELSRHFCRTPEDYKAWSQNLGHDDPLTTFRFYGAVSPGRQGELMARFRKRGPYPDDDDDVLE